MPNTAQCLCTSGLGLGRSRETNSSTLIFSHGLSSFESYLILFHCGFPRFSMSFLQKLPSRRGLISAQISPPQSSVSTGDFVTSQASATPSAKLLPIRTSHPIGIAWRHALQVQVQRHIGLCRRCPPKLDFWRCEGRHQIQLSRRYKIKGIPGCRKIAMALIDPSGWERHQVLSP